MKKLFCAVVALILATAMVAGCAGNGRSPSDKDDDEKESSATTTQSGQDGTTGSSGTKPGFPWGDDNDIPEGLSGKDVAKLLLANERLNAGLLKNEGDIFENGKKVFSDLKNIAASNLDAGYSTLAATPFKYKELTPVEELAKTTINHKYGGIIEIDGNSYRWSDFKESNNSYEAFEVTTLGIIRAAEAGSALIDNIKKNVRVVDKWVRTDMGLFYLHVEENSETLYQQIHDRYEICRRYKNSDGKDVYELYLGSEGFVERMTYIPGERYEHSTYHPHIERSGNFITASSSKGYWEVYWVGEAPQHYNVSYFIMKDDICFDSFYDPEKREINTVKVMSADKKTDFMSIMNVSYIDFKFSGFDGVDYIEVIAEPGEVTNDPMNAEAPYKILNCPDPVHGDNIVPLHTAEPTVYLKNGRTVKNGDKFVDGKVEIHAVRVAYYAMSSYTAELGLNIQASTTDETLEILERFIAELGLTCRRDLDETLSGVKIAYDELAVISQYYKWNGVCVATIEGVTEAVALEYEKIAEFGAMFDGVKDAEIIDINDTEKLELNMIFPEITENTFKEVKYGEGVIALESISLSIEDTLLCVKDEPYTVAFALIAADGTGGLIHLSSDNADSVKYAGESKFTVNAENVTVGIPALSPGEYTVVAYISTADGIRSSQYVKVVFEEVSAEPLVFEWIELTAEKGSDGYISFNYIAKTDVSVEHVSREKLDYSGLRQLMAETASSYGTPNDTLVEMLGADGNYTALAADSTEIADGQYRMAYHIDNADYVLSGYVYLTYKYDSPISEGEISVTVTADTRAAYAEFISLITERIAEYGTPKADAKAELLAEDGNYTALSGNEETVENGIYRIALTAAEGTPEYVYVIYSVKEAETEDQPSEPTVTPGVKDVELYLETEELLSARDILNILIENVPAGAHVSDKTLYMLNSDSSTLIAVDTASTDLGTGIYVLHVADASENPFLVHLTLVYTGE